MTEKHLEEDSIPFFPHHVSTEFRVVVVLTVLAMAVGLVGLLAPVGVGEPADPLNTPAHVKPEWYFLSLYQLLKFIPKTAGAVIPVIAVILLILLPFIDFKPDKSRRIKWIRLIIAVVGLVILIALTIWGEVS
jgi:cytochrome b6-f complex subunit 4